MISHEVPRCLLKQSRSFNAYDYAFAHLYNDPDFHLFYKESVDLGRKVLLDNSAFELGAGIFDTFGDIIVDLKPTWYVVPDVRHDGPATIASYEKFIKTFPDLPGTSICAIQGETFEDLADCYKFMIEKTAKIAIPFDSKGYDQTLKPWERRPAFLEKLSQMPFWKENSLPGISLRQIRNGGHLQSGHGSRRRLALRGRWHRMQEQYQIDDGQCCQYRP